MANVYFGNTLTDLQGALTNADRIEQERAAARARNETGLSQQMMQQATARQQNQIAREQMAQSGFFNQGRLDNERARIAAELEIAKANAAGADRRFSQEDATRRYVADQSFGARDRTPEIAAQENELATAAENLANILNQRDLIQGEISKIEGVVSGKMARGNEYFTTQGTAAKEFQPQLSGYFAGQPIDFGAMSFDQAATGARANLDKQLQDLNMIVTAAQEGGAANLVTKAPTGKWVSNYRPSTQGGSRFFGAPTAPNTAPAPGTLVRQNGVLYRFDGQNYLPLTE